MCFLIVQGSPIGATIAHVLIAHKAELGIKYISGVAVVTNEPEAKPVWGEKPRRDLQLFFVIQDVPADKVTPDKPEESPKPSPDIMALRAKNDSELSIRLHTMKL